MFFVKYCFFRNKFAEKIYPKLQYYVLLQPVIDISESDDKIIYSINNEYKYDSIDIVILKQVLEEKSIRYLMSSNNTLLLAADDIGKESLVFIEAARFSERKNMK